MFHEYRCYRYGVDYEEIMFGVTQEEQRGLWSVPDISPSLVSGNEKSALSRKFWVPKEKNLSYFWWSQNHINGRLADFRHTLVEGDKTTLALRRTGMVRIMLEVLFRFIDIQIHVCSWYQSEVSKRRGSIHQGSHCRTALSDGPNITFRGETSIRRGYSSLRYYATDIPIRIVAIYKHVLVADHCRSGIFLVPLIERAIDFNFLTYSKWFPRNMWGPQQVRKNEAQISFKTIGVYIRGNSINKCERMNRVVLSDINKRFI